MHKIEADHFKYYKYPYKLEINESGTIAYAVASVDVENNRYPVSLFVRLPENNWQSESIVLEDADISDFKWNGDTLIINALKEKEDKEKGEKGTPLSVIYSYNLLEKDVKELFRLNKKITRFKPLSSGRWLLLCSDNSKNEQDENYIIIDEYPFRSDDDGLISGIRQRLYIYETGEPRLLSPEAMNIGKISVYNEEYAIFSGVEYEGFWDVGEKLYHIDLETLEISVFDEKDHIYTDVKAEKDAVIAVRSDRTLFGEEQNEYIDRISLADKTVTRLNGDCEIHVHNNIYTNFSYGMEGQGFIPYKNGVYFIATILDKSYICFGDFDSGEIKPVTGGDMVIEDFRLYGGSFLILAMERLFGPEIYFYDKSGANQVTGYNDWTRGAFDVSPPESFTLMSDDGKAEIYGYTIKPTGFCIDKKYPAILMIHGGPGMAYSDCFYHDMQLLANNGYCVLFCNPRGSIGHGADFADLRLAYYTVDYDDIMQFFKTALLKNTWIDENRLGVIGGSYGGMMTNWIITHTDMFKAAVSDRGVSYEMQDYFMSDCGLSYARDVFGKTAWDDGGAEAMWEKSSIAYAPAVKTPTLFLHATNDFRCSKEQGIIFFSALKYLGIDSRLVLIKDESHNYAFSGKPKNRIRRFEEIIVWFNKYLKYK